MAGKKAATKPGTQVAVAKKQELAVGLPDFLKDYSGPRGTEGIESQDVTIPRLKIGQAMSKEVKDGKVAEGDLYLNITGEVLAKAGETLRIVLIARGKEFILWRPRNDNGGGILARAKPVPTGDGVRYAWDKSNTSFDVKIDGKTKATWNTKKFIDEDGLDQWGSEFGYQKNGDPVNADSGIAATAHHNFIVMLPDHGNIVAAMSLSRSQTKKAKDWNAALKLSPAPIFSRLFTVATLDEPHGNETYKNFDIKPAGFVDGADFASVYKPTAAAFAGKAYNVDHSDGDDTVAKDERV